MTADHGLLRPMGPDSLKPRPSTQAVWPAAAQETAEKPCAQQSPPPAAAQEESAPQTPPPAAEQEESAAQLPADPALTFAPPCTREQPKAEQEEPETPAPAPETLEGLISSVLSEEETDDDDEDLPAHDAMPTESMPVPAAVPLFDLPAGRTERGTGTFVMFLFSIAAAACSAAYCMGWLM